MATGKTGSRTRKAAIRVGPKLRPLTVGMLRQALKGLNKNAEIIKWSDIMGEYTQATHKLTKFYDGRKVKALEIQFF